MDTPLLQGTLDLLILHVVAETPRHGWEIGRQIEERSGDVLRVQQGSLYPALRRLERAGLLRARWGRSESNRRARYYRLTRAGRRRLRQEEVAWTQLSAAIDRVLEAP